MYALRRSRPSSIAAGRASGSRHSFIFGFVFAVLVLAVTSSRSWALGILIGQWAHVLTDVADTAGVMPFFPFSTETVTISMWKHAAAEGRYGDAAATTAASAGCGTSSGS